MIYEKLNCRLCGGFLKKVFDLGETPIANSFPMLPDRYGERFPLRVMQCQECEHHQLSHVVDRDTLYGDYKYSTPKAFIPHLEKHADELRAKYTEAKTVLEIGCNNGQFLGVLKARGFEVWGADPASPNPDWRGFFGDEYARKMDRKFDLIVANNVFAHIDNLHDVFVGIRRVIADAAVLVFEVQYLPAMLDNGTFDMIYHEHHSYHSLAPLPRFLQMYGWYLTDYQMIPTHGGSIRVTCTRLGPHKDVPHETIDWTTFAEKIAARKLNLEAKLSGNVAMFGATAKACTLLNYFGIADKIAYCIDETPQKQNRYIPGTDIKINEELGDPDMIFLSAWNYEQEIRARFPGIPIVTP